MPGSDAHSRISVNTILIAEQDEAARAVLENILKEQGFKPLMADDTERCMFLSLQKNIDAFILDLDTSQGDAAAFCARLRGIDRYKRTPILFTTSSPTCDRVLDAFHAGADDLIEKPINPVIAAARLRGHLQRMAHLGDMERERANLNRYVSTKTRQMVERCASPEMSLEPEERDVCVLFSDVRGFTALSQDMTPNALFRLLSRHLAMQVDCVYRRGGYVDKFGGDGIMAIFDSGDGVYQACHCALEILETTRLGGTHDGPPILPLGVGLNLGPVLIGNIGSDEHLDYSAIGETVNLAARLCGSAPPMSAVVSESVASAADTDSSLDFVNRHTIDVRGFNEPVVVCSLERGALPRRRSKQPAYAKFDFDRRST